METSTSYKLLMLLQLSIFSFVRSREMQFFFCKCVWSLELLTFRGFCKEKTDSPLNPDFFNTLLRTSSCKQRLNPCTSISVSSSGNPSRPFSSTSSPAFSPPGALLPWVWGFSLRMQTRVDAPNGMVEFNGTYWGLSGSRRIHPRKSPMCWTRNTRAKNFFIFVFL